MFKFTLALLAGAVSAQYSHGNIDATIPQGFYGSTGHSFKPSHYPTSPTSQHSQSSPSHQPTSHSGSHHGSYFPQPPAPPTHYNYNHYPHQHTQEPADGGSSEPDQQDHHAHYDPWNSENHSGHTAPVVVPDGWFSATQQYSDPKIPFVPTASKPTFAICQYFTDSALATIQFAQLPGYPSWVMGEVDNIGGIAPGDVTSFRVNKLGRTFTDDAACTAEVTGDEFNPLIEKNHYGQLNPFQDPSRGRIDDCTAEDDDETGCVFKQKDFLMNVNDIIGRSITVYNLDINGDEQIQGCCTVGIDETPDHFKPKPAPQPHYGGHHSFNPTHLHGGSSHYPSQNWTG